MRNLSIVMFALLVGGCGSRASRACDRVKTLCGSEEIAQSCATELPELKDRLGADNYDRMLSCAASATSCPEAVGCMAGGFSNMADRWSKEFEQGARKVMDH